MFIFDTNLNILNLTEKLANEAKYLINILKTKLSSVDILSQYQIELRKININDDQCLTFQM